MVRSCAFSETNRLWLVVCSGRNGAPNSSAMEMPLARATQSTRAVSTRAREMAGASMRTRGNCAATSSWGWDQSSARTSATIPLPHCMRLHAREVSDILADLAEACEAPVTLDDKIELLQLRDAARTGGVQHQFWRIVQGCGEELDGRGHAS